MKLNNYCFSSLKVSLCAHMWSAASLPETYHSRRTWVRGRSSRAGAAGTCQAWCGEAPPRCCSPYPQPATLQWDSSPARRSVTRKQHIPMSNEHQLYLNLKIKRVSQPATTLTTLSVWKAPSYLWGKVVLLELPSLPQVPRADSVVEPSGPQFGPVVRDIDAAGSICVALELPATTQSTKHRVRNRGDSLSNSNSNHFVLQTQRAVY